MRATAICASEHCIVLSYAFIVGVSGCSSMRSGDVLHDHFPDVVALAVQHCLGAIDRHADHSLG